MVHITLLNSKLTLTDTEGMLEFFRNTGFHTGSHQICIANVHTLMLGIEDPLVRSIARSAAAVTMDGLPLVWLARCMGFPQAARVAGPDLFDRICSVSAREGYRHFLYGGAEGVATRLKAVLEERYPGIQVLGAVSPPFRPLTSEEDDHIVQQINAAAPHFLWVGLGAPKQEKWIFEHLDRIHVPFQIGIGAAFDFFAGTVERAPLWMQKLGLEWLFRLSQDPARLWKRYLIYNTKFIWKALPEILKGHNGTDRASLS
jgi:N-acetylglucosaminyldiphosphoundecaprenol N-acetyl-beta-D-mannosaminyltransferase